MSDNPHYLDDSRARDIFDQQIVPERFGVAYSHHDDGRQPIAVIVVGQPGAGKTRIADACKAVLNERGGAAHIVGDFYKPYHPDYTDLLARDPEHASPLTSPDARRWNTMATEYAISQRADVLLESAGRDPAKFAEVTGQFRASGYRVQAVILAVNEANSRLGIVSRFHEQVRDTGDGRLTARKTHDVSYRGISAVADFIDRSDSVDAVDVVRRGNIVLYTNARDEQRLWQRPPAARETVQSEHDRRWTPEQTLTFARKLSEAATGLGPDWLAELEDIKALGQIHADPQMTLPDLAEAVRRFHAPHPEVGTLTPQQMAATAFTGTTAAALGHQPGPPRTDPQPGRNPEPLAPQR